MQITSASDFLSISKSGADTFNLTTDIDFHDTEFVPQVFAGTFQGNGHTLRNINISRADEEGSVFYGVFSNLCADVNISNLLVENVYIRYINYDASFIQQVSIGCVIGSAYGAVLENVTLNTCSILTAGNMNIRQMGGLVG